MTPRRTGGSRHAPFAAVCATAVVLTACGGSGASGSAPTAGAPAPPLSSSQVIAGDTWVSVPMGQVGHPSNTYWQVFILPGGRGRWRLVTPPGTATNGGVTIAAGATARPTRVVVAFGASELLGFSPLASTTTDGRQWQVGTLPNALVAAPQSLTVTPSGGLIAITAGGVEATKDGTGATGWRALPVNRTERSCGLGQINLVAAPTTRSLVVGGSCTRGGAVGLFEAVGAIKPLLPDVALPHVDGSDIRASVIRFSAIPERGPTALIGGYGARGEQVLFALWGRGPGRAVVSQPLVLAAGQSLLATGATASGGWLALGTRTAAVLAAGSSRWTLLPTPPSGTASLATGANGRVDALVVAGSRFLDYVLHGVTGRWALAQTLRVPIAYGSSG